MNPIERSPAFYQHLKCGSEEASAHRRTVACDNPLTWKRKLCSIVWNCTLCLPSQKFHTVEFLVDWSSDCSIVWNKQFHSCSTSWNLLFHSVELKNEFLADFCSTVTPQFSSTVATQLFHTLSNSTLWKNFGKWTKSWNIIFHSFSTVFTQMGHTFHILWNTLVFSSVYACFLLAGTRCIKGFPTFRGKFEEL